MAHGKVSRLFNGPVVLREFREQISVSAPIGTVENKRIVASYGFIHTPVDLIGVFFIY